MANGFGSLYVGSSGLRSAQNALNVVANNLTNIDTEGYVRQQVIFEDQQYNQFAIASVSSQKSGLGVSIGDVIHARDIFLDRAYRTESGRSSFYAANYEATQEVETLIQESLGEQFGEAINDLYEAFAEFAKDPSDTVNLNLVSQKASLFITRSQGVYDGLKTYQTNLNAKITDDVDRINELAEEIFDLNLQIQKIEAGGVETAMTLRDERDAALDELASLADITYSETADSVVKVKLEGVDFIIESRYFEIGLNKDDATGLVTPYWTQLSNPDNEEYYNVFDLTNVDATKNTDIGEIKGLLLARGDYVANYMDMAAMSSDTYSESLANSVIMNSEAEIDKLVNMIATSVNNLLSPIKEYGGETITGIDENGKEVTITSSTRIFDEENASLGSDGQIPTQELFTRTGCSRYTKVTLDDDEGTVIYVYNEEDPDDTSKCYTTGSLSVNQAVVEDATKIPHLLQNGGIDYTLGEDIYQLWEDSSYYLNPADESPTTLHGFYTKFVGELSTMGSVFKTTSETLEATTNSIESNRQGVVGVSSDEELTNMIKYQNAYNAASRYITVVSEMIEHLLTSLG